MKGYRNFLNEGAKVNESGTLTKKVMIPAEIKISYDIDKSIWEEFHGSEEAAALEIADELDILEGYIEWDSDTFRVKGKTKFGNFLFATQEGEYNMYGGPYSPIMKKPAIRLEDRDITKMVIKYLEKEVGVENMRGKKSGYNFPDISRVDLWSNLLIKLR